MTSTRELHISGVVVHATPARVRQVSTAVAALAGACVHAQSEAGKVVVTLEAGSADEMVGQLARIRQIDGVLSTALVYQCADTVEAMNEVIDDGDDPT